MSHRSLLIPGILAGALMLPVGANAQQPVCEWGPRGNCAQIISETLSKVSVDLQTAIETAGKEAKGSVQMARLSAFGLPGEGMHPFARGKKGERLDRDKDGPAVSGERTLEPMYLVALGDADSRTLVSVDAESGKAEVVGTATGVFATRHMGMMMGPGGGWHHKGGHQGWGAKGFGPAMDTSAYKINATQAVKAAADTMKDARPVMVRGVESDEGPAWMVAMKTAADETSERSVTMVFVNPSDGKVLRSQTFEPGKFDRRDEDRRGPRSEGPRGEGPRKGDGPRPDAP